MLGLSHLTKAKQAEAIAIEAAGGPAVPGMRRIRVRWPGTIPPDMMTGHTAEAYGIALDAAGWRLSG